MEISSHGPTQSSIAIVTDYPSKEEVLLHLACSGKIGNLIAFFLKKAGYNYDECYKTSVIKGPIPGVETRNKRTRSKLIKAAYNDSYLDLLKKEFTHVRPNVIMAVGELALNVLCNHYGIHKYRGSILSLSSKWDELKLDAKIIPVLHPRDIWEQYEAMSYSQLDWKKINRVINLQGRFHPEEMLWICRTPEALTTYWKRAREGEFLTFDIETHFGYISCISFCTDGREAISVPLLDVDGTLSSIMLWRQIDLILRSPIPKVNQNLKFDVWFLHKWGFQVANIHDDTLILAHNCYPELPKRLDFLTSIHTLYPFYKDEGRDFVAGRDAYDQLYLYNAKDALVTWQIYDSQRKDAKELKVWDFHRRNYFSGNPTLYDIYIKMEKLGIRVDEAKRQQLLNKYKQLEQLHQNNLNKVLGKELNINSPKQVGQFIYEVLKVPLRKHVTESGESVYSTDKETLEDLYINHISDPNIKTYLREIIILRKVKKILEFLNIEIHPDGRLRTSYKLHGTKSGRTSTTTTPDRKYFITDKGLIDYTEYGIAFQTIPKRGYEAEEWEGEVFGADIPSIFVPSPGYSFLEIDGKSAEALVVFILANDIESYQFALDGTLHKLTASWMLNKPIDTISKYEREIYGKRPRHAGHYDMGPYRLSLMIHKPVEECEKLLDIFHTKAPRIRSIFHTSIRELLNRYGVVFTPLGRRRDFFSRKGDEVYKSAYSYIPQSLVSDHTKFSMPMFAQYDVRLLAEKHDGIFMEVPSEKLVDIARELKRIYERPINMRNGSIPREFDLIIPAEISWSNENWERMIELCLD